MKLNFHMPNLGEAGDQFTLEVKRRGATVDETALCPAGDNPVRASRERQRKACREQQGKADVFGDVRVLSAAGSTTGDGHGKNNSDAISI